MTPPPMPHLRAPALLCAFALLPLLAGCGDEARADDDADRACDEDCPYADTSPSLGTTTAMPLRGRIVEEDPPVSITNADPYKMMAQEELDRATASLTLRAADGRRFALPDVRADEEGYIDTRVPLPADVPAGEHTLEVRVSRVLAGEVPTRLLPAGHDGIVVRSDVDMTYLVTDFQSAEGLARLLEADARERTALPAMPAVYQALRAGADGRADRPLCFLSGSPRFFKRTLQGKMQLDGIEHDGLILKPFKDILVANLLDFDFDEIKPELEEQIGYKLAALLTLRLDIPPTTREVLLGDDTEADHAIYALYNRFTSGRVDAAALDAQLAELAVAQAWRDRVAALAPQVAAHMAGHLSPVRAIYINGTETPAEVHAVADWIEPGLTRYHRGAWPLALDLFEEGLISAEAVASVRAALDARGVAAATRAEHAAAAVAAGFVEQATVDRFAAD